MTRKVLGIGAPAVCWRKELTVSKNDMLGAVTVRDVQGVVTDLIEKLGGENGQDWLKASKRFLRKEDPWAVPGPSRPADGPARRFLHKEKSGEHHIIDCSAAPHIPDAWLVHPEDQIASRFQGSLIWSPDKIRLHLDPAQECGSIRGEELQEKLEGLLVLPANVLDYLLDHPSLIPSDWKGKDVYFWGTVYRNSDGARCVRYLDWGDGGWHWHGRRLDSAWNSGDPAAVLAG